MENERWIQPVTLTGQYVTLEPLELSHIDALRDASKDGALWRLWFTSVPAPDETESYVRSALARQDEKGDLAFVVRDNASDAIAGTTRFCYVDPVNLRLEIGYTWYAQRFQRTAVNTESKLLLLTHAFEHLNCIAVELRTHFHNHASRSAIERLGAKQDGILRQHKKDKNGLLRDTVVFSILDREWPTVKRGLEFRLEVNRA